ncbi:MAG: hypothetical protein RL092_860, partial [Bacteroidota bacterium]
MKRIQLISLCISILLLLGYNAKSNTGTYEYRIGSGGTSALNLGSSLSCTANSPGSGVTRIQESAYLILGVDYSVVTQTTDYNAIVTLAVTWTTVNGIQNESISLQVNFLNGSTNPKDLAINTKTGAFSVSASITNIVITDLSGNTISSVPTNLYCLSRVIVDRIYPFIAGATTNINPTSFHVSNLDEDMDGAMESLFIQWSQVTGAESYDLEWTFVNNYKYEISNYGSLSLIKPISELYFDFSLNSTRISTTNNSYIIPKLFERGVVIFRIRAVGKSTDSPYHNVFGNWSLNDGRIYINDVEYPNYYVFISAHEADMNWQLTTTFAEDGKRKDVISYFDGGNKNRQTVTRMRSTGAAVVGETIYDLYNRPTIQVLPAPVMLLNVPQANEFHLPELNASSSIHFYRNFNMNEHGTVYTSEDAMEDPNAICDIVTPPMSTLSGASNYYSSLNPGVVDNTISTGEETAFVPDASGYPFSKVLYTNDNTGRIKKQGGVGLEYQINSEHETTYSYGVPQQIELDRLFGSNVGNADHYKKNSVRDANGQVSVSYMDMSDKVVATALVGDAPSNMVNIDSYPSYSSGYLTSDLFNENAFGVSISNHLNTSNSGFIFTKQIVVPANGDYFFDFNFNVEPLDLPCESNICAECVYDCYISVVDECNESVYRYPENGTTLVGSFISSEQGYSFVTSCGNTDGEVINGHSFTLALTPGSYTISKRITVNEDAVDFYVNQYMSSEYASCVQTIDQFIQEYIENVEVEQCAVTWDCQTCIDELGDRDTYIANGPYSNDVNALTYDWRYEECADLCKPLSTCKAGFLSMIQDMQPNGQYAEYLLNNSIQPSEFPLSVFNTNNQLPYSQQYSQVNWKSPRIILNGHEYPYYLNGDGTRSLIPVSVNANTNSTSPPSVPNSYFAVNGVNYVYPEKLINLSDFIANWNSSWASSLVRYHPEYCYYESCKEYNTLAYSNDYLTSDQFDKLLEDAISFNDAVNAGLITANLTGGTINTSNPYNIANWFPSIISGELPYSNESSDLNGADVLYDPFVVRGNSLLEIFSGEESPTYGAQLQTYFNNCQSGLSIEQMAAYIVINEVAPSLVGAANINYGNYFGANLGIGSMYNTNRDKMWTIAKTLYIQKKRELQHRRDALYTINECAAYNACFQNEDFDNSELGFSESLSLAIYQYQPCNEEHIELYQNKTPRFISAAQGVANLQNLLNSDSSFEEVCPGEVILENFLSSLINVHHLTGSSIPISGSEFSNLVPIIVPYASNSEVWNENLFWNAVIQTNELIGVIQNSSGQDLCSIHLSKPEYLTDWNQIIGLQGLRGNEANSLFTVLCRYITDDGNM